MTKILTALLALALLGALPARAVAAEPVRIGFQKGGGLLTALKRQGAVEKAFAPAGTTVKWIEFPAGPQMLEALNAGSIDFGTTGAPPPVFAQAAGIDVVYVGAEPPPVASEAIIVKPDSPIRTVAQLKGKRIAFAKGSGSHLLLVAALNKAGLTIRDVKPIFLGPSEARAAFDGGSVDAWVVWDPYLAAAQKAYSARVVADYTGLLQANGFYLASRAFVKRSPQAVGTLLQQIALAGKWANTHRKEMVAIMAPQVGVAPDVIATWLGRQTAGVVPMDAAIVANQQKVADLFYREKLIPRPVTIATQAWTWQRR
ncbi:aliphatic sulfonate ABC transporter substrate-binding protein [Massilia dura]|uniref:Putative aliphatic sulfonates-binding protein n=1 Tax=Pseudoduganella dura TaxID=321982 RepID=A0A6I3XBC6_9BURK|nr:sulfonate ABC transporter substrate-binding protein [Pseudoduganella dura]MUI12986.1 aliphatic sulfonate ABC transporter substrate-binding protein [Pseudoduganella dura]GGX88095.1 aliphatic sulfonate ABC transporter substrate-binding protein [Pseudoduganella dura]